MATHAPITGAPTRAPETRSVSDRAVTVQLLLGRIASLADGINRLPDNLPPITDDVMRLTWGHVCNFADLIEQVAKEANEICEGMEVDTR